MVEENPEIRDATTGIYWLDTLLMNSHSDFAQLLSITYDGQHQVARIVYRIQLDSPGEIETWKLVYPAPTTLWQSIVAIAEAISAIAKRTQPVDTNAYESNVSCSNDVFELKLLQAWNHCIIVSYRHDKKVYEDMEFYTRTVCNYTITITNNDYYPNTTITYLWNLVSCLLGLICIASPLEEEHR